MADGIAMFRFDTNINKVASEITSGLGRINSSLSAPMRLSTPALAQNTAGLGQMFGRLEGDLSTRLRSFQNMLAAGVDPSKIRETFQRHVREGLGGIPKIMANEIGLAPNTVATTAPIKQIAQANARGYVNSFRDALRSGAPHLYNEIKGLNFGPDIAKIGRTPLALGQETSQIAAFRNQLRAEGILRRDPVFGPESQAKAASLGFNPAYMQALKARTVQTTTTGGVTDTRFTETDARQRLMQATRDAQAGATSAKRYDSSQAALAKMTTEQANLTRLTQNWASVVPVGQYQVLAGEVYRLGGAGAVRIENEAQVLRVLERQEAMLASQAATAARLSQQETVRAAKAEAAGGGFSGGFATRFNRGKGSMLNTLGGQVASAASFTLGYGVLFGMVGVVKDLQHEFSDYQDSLTDLQIATGGADRVTNEFTNSLSDMARVTGENLGAAMDTAARGIRAFGNPMESTQKQLEEIGVAANTAANQLALVANKSLKDATGDTLAVGTAFGMQPDQLTQIVDAVANAKRSLGGDPAQISQGLASISSSAKAAGFDLNQAAALISLVQARTDESGQAAATRLTRIFQTVSGSTGKRLGLELGVDTNQSARKQLEEYSAKYNDPNTSKAVKDRISSSLGGTANLRELLPILRDGARLQEAYGEAASNAGQGESEFARKSDNLVGTMKKIRGDIKAIEVDLTRTSIFAPFGAAIVTLEPVLHLLDRMLKVVDGLPGPLRHSAALLVDMAIAAKVLAVVANVRATRMATRAAEAGLVQAAPTVGRVAVGTEAAAAGAATAGARGAATGVAAAEAAQARLAAEAQFDAQVVGAGAARAEAEAASLFRSVEARNAAVAGEVAAITGATELRLAAEERMDAVIVEASAGRVASERAGMAAGAGMLARTLINPWTYVIGVLVGGAWTINNALTGIDQRNKYLDAYSGTGAALGRGDGSSTSLRAAATDLRAAAGTIRRSDANTALAKDARSDMSKSLASQARQLDGIAKGVEREQRANAVSGSKGTFGDGGVVQTIDELSLGLKALSDSGVTALGQMNALSAALHDTAQPGSKQVYNPKQFAADTMGNAFNDLRDVLPKQVMQTYSPQPGYTSYGTYGDMTVGDSLRQVTSKDAYEKLRADNSPNKINDAIAAASDKLGYQQGQVLTAAQKTKLARAAADAFDLSSIPEDAKEVREKLFQRLYADATGQGHLPKTLSDLINGALPELPTKKKLLNGKGGLDRGQVLSLLRPDESGDWVGLAAQNQAALGAIPASDDGSQRQRVLKKQVSDLKSLQRRAAKKGVNIPELNLLLRNTEDDYMSSQIERLEDLRHAAQNDAAGNKRKVKAIGIASLKKEIDAAAANGKRLLQIMQNADQAALDIVRAHLVAAQRIANANAPLGNTPANPTIAHDPVVKTPAQKAADAALGAFDAERGKVNIPDKGSVYTTGSDSNEVSRRQAADKKTKKDAADKLTRAQRAALRQQALTNPLNSVSSARADLAVAKANLDAIKGHGQDYYSALRAVTEAQNSVAQAVASRSGAIANMNAARAGGGAMATARAALIGARAGLTAPRGTEEWANQMTALYDAQNGMRQAAADRVAARASARGARIGGGIAEARAGITAAAAQLHIYARGTAEWFGALGSFYSAQQQMRDAILAYRTAQDQLHGDITDPVENARDALRASTRAVHAARGKDAKAEARVQVRQDRAGLQDAKFQQRLSDWQTSEDLDRMSFSKHMALLDHEHDRLKKIHHRTRQQQDELDTVDKAMKDALNSMNSQFNLGDINTNGLVYQMRRFKAEFSGVSNPRQNTGVVGPNGATSTQNVTISINGADTAKVRTIIDGYLGTAPAQRRTTARRKI